MTFDKAEFIRVRRNDLLEICKKIQPLQKVKSVTVDAKLCFTLQWDPGYDEVSFTNLTMRFKGSKETFDLDVDAFDDVVLQLPIVAELTDQITDLYAFIDQSSFAEFVYDDVIEMCLKHMHLDMAGFAACTCNDCQTFIFKEADKADSAYKSKMLANQNVPQVSPDQHAIVLNGKTYKLVE